MAYVITETLIGAQPIAVTDTTQNHPLGTIVRAKDPTYGVGEFIYLPGVASTAVGSVVCYNTGSFVTELAPAGSNVPESVAVAMSANVASQYGWYQISGIATAAKAANTGTVMTAGTAVGVSTAGLVIASVTGQEMEGASVNTTLTTGTGTTVLLSIDRPHMQGRIT